MRYVTIPAYYEEFCSKEKTCTYYDYIAAASRVWGIRKIKLSKQTVLLTGCKGIIMLFSGQGEFWYVLFVFDGYEQKVTDAVNKHYNSESLFAFLPKKDKWFIGRGKQIKESELLFPGYVFIETCLRSDEFIALTKQFITNSREIIRILCNGDAGDIAVKEHERLAWSHLLGKENCIETSVGFIENEKIYIEYGALKGSEGMIKKMDRHKREAIIEMDFMGRMINVNVAVQLIRKIV